MRSTPNPSLVCVSCEGEIVGRPEFHVGLAFCCSGCVVGGPCTCSYDIDDVVADAFAAPIQAVPARRSAVPA